ncbi:toxin [Aquibacillus sp. 3ASR75-11]|uniref:Toxin n=1 Tax=Terrihalobacillus insolitus TaxID=2950438 RepID=A0A9X3WWL4_9BACI|nr:toxin [Terrihalobacillus insolitus]MDC3412986.1 toxin [Terrihalobacillus insolitus]MDC3424739.1 toxin [Terrihalobacillus insolitus]
MLIFLFLVLPFIDITRPFQGLMLSKAVAKKDIPNMNSLSNIDLLRQLVVIPDNLEDKDELGKMIYRINQIDRPVLSLLVNQRVKVRLFQGSLTDEPLLYFLRWEKPRGWKKDVTWTDVPGSGGGWLVSAKIGASEPGSGHGSINLELHEIGHTVYKLLKTSPVYAEKIQEIWKMEADQVYPDNAYFLNYSTEYFAEMFATYYYSDETANKIADNAPQTYQLFSDFVSLKTNKITRNYYYH